MATECETQSVVVKRPFSPNWPTESVQPLSKSPWASFPQKLTSWSQSVWGNAKHPEYIAKTILKEKNKIEGLVLPIFKTSHTAATVRTARSCHRNRHTGPWDRTESPAAKSYRCIGNWFSTKVPRNSIGKKNLFNKQCGLTWHPHAKNK